MKYITRVLVVCAIFVTLLTVAEIKPAAARCLVGSGSNPPSSAIPFTVIKGHRYTIVSTILGTFTTPPATITVPTNYPILVGDTIAIYDEDGTCAESQATFAIFNDGRENAYDAAQTVAVYCDIPRPGDLRVYAIFDNVGKIAFTVNRAKLRAGEVEPSEPYLISSGLGAELWRLPNGDLRIQRGEYSFDWAGC